VGELNIDINSKFVVKKLKIKHGFIDYELGERERISAITYENQDIEWSIDSYEGTGDNSFDFVFVK